MQTRVPPWILKYRLRIKMRLYSSRSDIESVAWNPTQGFLKTDNYYYYAYRVAQNWQKDTTDNTAS